MKASQVTEPKFIPVVLTLETQTEVDALFAMFMHIQIREAAGLPCGTYKVLELYTDAKASGKLHDALNGLLK